jgi:ribonuclease P protein component
MLPREKRLANPRDFKRVYQKGSFFSAGIFNAKYLPNKLDFTRIGIVVSKKISKKATERNKIKRLFREAFRALHQEVPTGLDIVVNVNPNAQGLDLIKITAKTKESLGKIKK